MATEDMAKNKDTSIGRGFKLRDATSPERESYKPGKNPVMPSSMGGGVNNLDDTIGSRGPNKDR